MKYYMLIYNPSVNKNCMKFTNSYDYKSIVKHCCNSEVVIRFESANPVYQTIKISNLWLGVSDAFTAV